MRIQYSIVFVRDMSRSVAFHERLLAAGVTCLDPPHAAYGSRVAPSTDPRAD